MSPLCSVCNSEEWEHGFGNRCPIFDYGYAGKYTRGFHPYNTFNAAPVIVPEANALPLKSITLDEIKEY